jgi:hypothetical protein
MDTLSNSSRLTSVITVRFPSNPMSRIRSSVGKHARLTGRRAHQETHMFQPDRRRRSIASALCPIGHAQMLQPPTREDEEIGEAGLRAPHRI